MPKAALFDRDQVLDKSLKVFWEKGYHGASLQDLVDATGLNRSSLYNSFQDKFNLYLQCIKHYRQQRAQDAQKALIKNKSALTVIRDLLESALPNKKTTKDPQGCFLVNCTAELSADTLAIRPILHDNKDSMLELLTNLVQQAQVEGDVNPNQDPEMTALYLFSSIQGLNLTSVIEDDPQKLDKLVDSILKAL